MSQPQRMTDLMQGHPAHVFRAVIISPGHVREDKDIRAAMIPADGVAVKGGAASRWNIVQDDVSLLLARLRAGHIGERDGSIEAVLQNLSPGFDRLVDGPKVSCGHIRS